MHKVDSFTGLHHTAYACHLQKLWYGPGNEAKHKSMWLAGSKIAVYIPSLSMCMCIHN